MSVKSGNISIHAQNIMPIIKRWLYSDKDIFIRELVSNGCDAITKYHMIHPGNEETFKVTVEVDGENKQLRFIDNGIGMTGEEVEKYINQVAFSSAEEFLKSYTGENEGKGGIIGHFGLGFYSAFMVAQKVTIDTLSYKEGSEGVRWESEDGMAFTMGVSQRKERGTMITLDILDDENEFTELFKVKEVLDRYCAFMPYPVYLQDMKLAEVPEPVQEEPEGEDAQEEKKEQPKTWALPEAQLINDTHPLWLKSPKDCSDEEYIEFYKKTFRTYEDPLFWVHLNVDYPFNLKGILYFPKLTNEFGTNEGEIKLFSGQVFVANNIKEVIPEFLMLLKGVIDCPDLPLNVSRSFLQNDGYVRRLSAHITKKVADKLNSLFNTQREAYEGYWDDIHPFIKFGCMKDQKFFESVKGSLLFKTTDDKYFTLEEYLLRNSNKTDKKVIYTNDKKRQAASVALYTNREIDVVTLDNIIDSNFISFMEYGAGQEDKVTFVRVDGDISSLIEQSEEEDSSVDQEKIQELFREALEQKEMEVKVETLTDENLSAMVVEDEQSRRFKEMSKLYGQDFKMPDRYTLILNRKNPVIKALAAREKGEESTLLCKQVYDLARLSAQPLEADEITAFIQRSQKILELLTGDKE